MNPYYYNDRIYSGRYYQQEPREYIEERFRKNYNLYVETSKRHYRHKTVPVKYSDWMRDGSNIPFHQEVEREALLKVYMPKESYDHLVERERYLEEQDQKIKELSKIAQQQHEEAIIRNRNSALQKAWEKYQMLLELSR